MLMTLAKIGKDRQRFLKTKQKFNSIQNNLHYIIQKFTETQIKTLPIALALLHLKI